MFMCITFRFSFQLLESEESYDIEMFWTVLRIVDVTCRHTRGHGDMQQSIQQIFL